MKLISLSVNGTPINPPPGIPKPGSDMTGKILSNGITIFLVAGVIVSVLFIIWGGINWITSNGDKQKLASARARITWAIIGLVIMLISFLIINMIGYFLGVELLKTKF